MYQHMTETDKKLFIHKEYIINNKSFKTIAESVQSYANKIRRDAIKYGIQIRNKSEAQSNAIKTGTHKHPTKGTKRDKETKLKIGKSVMKQWLELDPQELNRRKDMARKNWESLDKDVKENILDKANKAVRESSKTGSKLEKFILNKLVGSGHRVDFHKEQVLANTRLQIDLFLPTMNLAIEIDGPSHFDNIWGDIALKRNKQYDQKKSGLITGKGFSLIRIKQISDFSETRATVLWDKLKELVKSYDSPKSIDIEY